MSGSNPTDRRRYRSFSVKRLIFRSGRLRLFNSPASGNGLSTISVMDQSSTNTNEEESPLEEPDRRSRSGATTPQRGPCRDDFRVTSDISEPSSGYFSAERRSPRRRAQSVENRDEDKGYDSDDGPFFDAVDDEGPQDLDDDESIGDGMADGEGASNEVPSVVGTFQDISLSNVNSFNVKRLRYELKIRGIDTKGLKKEGLQDRLKKLWRKESSSKSKHKQSSRSSSNICGDFQSPLIGKY